MSGKPDPGSLDFEKVSFNDARKALEETGPAAYATPKKKENWEEKRSASASEPLSDEANVARNRLMEAELDSPLRSIGRARDGSWQEEGFAVPFDRRAIDAAQAFAQAAIYLVAPGSVRTVFLVGADPVELDRLVADVAS